MLSTPGKTVAKAICKWLLLCVAAGFILRIVLLCHPITVASSLGFWQWVALFALGAVNDLCVGTLMAIPLAAFWMSSGHWKLRRPQCLVLLALLAAAWAWITFGCRTLWEFNKPLARILGWVMVWWMLSLALRAALPGIRRRWMQVWTAVILFVYTGVFLMNVVGEWFFWNEFGVRYNFIAVDYLIYTGEVVGNIMQSYSMGWIITGVVCATAATEWLLFRKEIAASADFHKPGWRLRVGGALAAASAVALMVLPLAEKAQHSPNAWYNGLQANGAYSFVLAFMSNTLDYDDFYVICPDELAAGFADSPAAAADSTERAPITPNIVLVTMESMSADYMARFGNEEHLTPALDSLWAHSLAFDRMFAAGNRTVRGLEALTLSRPPAPGESIIKREVNTGYPSVADELHRMGYDLRFYYGGNSYFDNMESFFSGMDYTICDRKTMDPADITCQTVWGVCDGDVYRRVLADIDSAARAGGPVFAHVLTTSNHRPYIYPEGCVSIPPQKQQRRGAVMYADYAVGRFIEEAATRPWFDNTVFVIVADHCASSAGSTELPPENYHIPAMIFAPALVEPETVNKVVSQIDLLPTLFSMLGWEADTRLYGRDALAPDFTERAFLATYQDLGFLCADTLSVLSPGRAYRQFVVRPTADNPFNIEPVPTPSMHHIHRAAALYRNK